MRLSGTKDPQQQQEALQSCLQALHQLKQQQEADAAAAHTLQEQLRGLQEEAAQLEEQVRAAEQQQKLSQKHLVQAAMSTKAAAAALQKAKQECKQLLQEFSRTDAVHTFNNNPQAAAAAAVSAPAGGQSSSPAPAAAACAQAAAVLTSAQLQQLIRSARQVQRKLLELDVPELLPGQKVSAMLCCCCELVLLLRDRPGFAFKWRGISSGDVAKQQTCGPGAHVQVVHNIMMAEPSVRVLLHVKGCGGCGTATPTQGMSLLACDVCCCTCRMRWLPGWVRCQSSTSSLMHSRWQLVRWRAQSQELQSRYDCPLRDGRWK